MIRLKIHYNTEEINKMRPHTKGLPLNYPKYEHTYVYLSHYQPRGYGHHLKLKFIFRSQHDTWHVSVPYIDDILNHFSANKKKSTNSIRTEIVTEKGKVERMDE